MEEINMADKLIRGLGLNDEVRIFSLDTTDTVNEAVNRHKAYPTAAAALGRTMTATVVLGAMLKGKDKVTVTVEGGGPIGAIVTDADANGHVRGYVQHPDVHFDLNAQGKLDVSRAVGTNGYLRVAKDIGLKDNFVGSVELISGELGEDFSYYFYHSEQVPSIVALGVLVNPDNTVKAAGGLVIQVLPAASEETITCLEKIASEMRPISQMIDDNLTPEQIVGEVLGDSWRKLDEMPVEFECTCSKERFINAIASLEKDEIKQMIEEDGGAEAVCNFCRNDVWIEKEELEALLEE